jgi:hypothetical protein
MPDYDEYGMSYKDRSALLRPAFRARKSSGITPAYNRMIVVDGRIVGSWRPSRGRSVSIETDYHEPLNRAELRAVEQATRRFSAFASGHHG